MYTDASVQQGGVMPKHTPVPPPTPRAAASAPTSAPAPAQASRPDQAVRSDPAVAASEGLRQAFRRHAAGVAVVTFTRRGEPVGFTATSVTSLSHRPPLISLALATTSSLVPALHAAETLIVHLLGQDARELAMRFAEPGADRFAPPTRWRRLETGEPLLADAAVWLRCRIRERISAGDHWLVITEVLDSHLERPVAPLVYHDGGYGTFHTGAPTAAAITAATGPGIGPAGQPDGDLGIRSASGFHRGDRLLGCRKEESAPEQGGS
ncbi:flavin reductase family protein, partial [Frankia sp. R82]|uniref:flavin reductase family protein n=1 Tax=Frankia sp. R82 TaxID=2950553 RepID=UPI0027E3B276